MTKNIEPQLKEIIGYLKLQKSKNFVIPEYQRAYSWEIDQCDKLWQDIEEFIASDASDPYFFGTIIIDCSEDDQFSLIDGQQRTTTFLLLMKALLIRLNLIIKRIPDNDEESESLKAGLEGNRNKIIKILYKADDEEIPSMLKDNKKIQNILILENKSINELYPEELKKIIEAIDFDTAEKNIYKIPRKQKDNKYTNYFRNFKFFYTKLEEKSDSQINKFSKIFLEKCQVIEIRSWQIEQAITMFNSLNSTGMPLADADIISAQLYSNSGTSKETFNEQWETINKIVNELNIRKIVDIDSILQQYMYINRAINKEYVSIKEDGKESIDVTTPGLRRYYTDIKKELLQEPLKLCDNLKKIALIWDKIKDYSIIEVILKFNVNVKLYLASYLYRFNPEDITEENVIEICECLLRLFTILEITDTGYSSTKFKTFLFRENVRFVEKSILIDTIQDDFKKHISENWDNKNIEDAVYIYEKNSLVYLNEYIYAKSQKKKFYLGEQVNVEHIMPASGRNVSTIQQDAGITDKEEFRLHINKLGNKILLEEDINKSLSNEWFKSKKQNSIKDKKGYKDSVYAIAAELTNYPKDIWTKEDIESATNNAVERIVKFIFN